MHIYNGDIIPPMTTATAQAQPGIAFITFTLAKLY